MDITLPAIPAGMLVLLALFAPYAIGGLNGVLPFIRRPWQKKALSIGVAVGLAAIILVGYYAYTGDILPDWPALVLLTVVVVQASCALITKSTATAVEDYFTPGETLRRDLR